MQADRGSSERLNSETGSPLAPPDLGKPCTAQPRLYVMLRPGFISKTLFLKNLAKRISNLKLPLMPLFSFGAIPQYFSRESPVEKMHAHLRSFSFYRKIVSLKKANYVPLSLPT